MKRTPIYHKEDSAYRVIYRPGGYWVAQFQTAPKGTRETDPWQDLHKPKATQEEALTIMYQRKPVKQSA